ncbi:DUF485 domain-containing protein [Streptomyces sp. S.PNR 29]|uniref:DUF485 domain-containing protein n=1 Tax=Streptomyces sp. S.PNR 29 TaxID=2973805 RepID=UPI0025B0AF0E|nr:DUF485 domain-containing protein [Streptomyces sp. S.PNR 29]MDN0198743.1 DUF485 domain-containing protein [Streptomyces sp. S.PNR 29]
MPEYSPWPDDSSTFQLRNAEPVGPQRISDDPEFHSLRRDRLRFGTRATILSVGTFLLYVLLSSFAPGMMNQPLLGRLTLGLALGLAQFAVMGVTAWCYVRHMSAKADPLARRLRAQRHRNETPRPSAVAQAPYNGTRGYRTW